MFLINSAKLKIWKTYCVFASYIMTSISDKINTIFNEFLQRMLRIESFDEHDLSNMLEDTKSQVLTTMVDYYTGQAEAIVNGLRTIRMSTSSGELCVEPNKKIPTSV
jgi:hypothetical protein